MSAQKNDRSAVALLCLLIFSGMASLTIPWFLTPPASLDLVLRDAVFAADLSAQRVIVTDQATGKTMSAAIRKAGSTFVAHIGRINSGKSSFTAQVTGYKPGTARFDAAALQNVRAPVDLLPTFGRVEIMPVNAISRDEPVAATVKDGDRVVAREGQRPVIIDLPPGKHRLTADAFRFCPADREVDVYEGKVTQAVLPLSPDLRDDEIARIVLGWRNEPRDLDSHFRKTDAVGFPHPSHLFWRQQSASFPGGEIFARLDVDERSPGRYETVTVRANARGDYRYFVHRFSGTGAIKDADAMVQIYTRGCRVQTFTPPADCSERIWNVANLRYDDNTVDINGLGTCDRAFFGIVPVVIKLGD